MYRKVFKNLTILWLTGLTFLVIRLGANAASIAERFRGLGDENNWVYIGTIEKNRHYIYKEDLTWISKDIVRCWIFSDYQKDSKFRQEYIEELKEKFGVQQEVAKNLRANFMLVELDGKNKKWRVLDVIPIDEKGNMILFSVPIIKPTPYFEWTPMQDLTYKKLKKLK
jgi:hypothetical protein